MSAEAGSPSDHAALAAFQPHPDPLTMPFWLGAADGRLVLSRCPDCRRWQHPPLEACRWCGTELGFEDAPMHGVVYSSSVMRHAAIPLYEPPYTVAVVEVGEEGGPRIVARVVDSDEDSVGPGRFVRIETRPLPGGDYFVPVAIDASDENLQGGAA